MQVIPAHTLALGGVAQACPKGMIGSTDLTCSCTRKTRWKTGFLYLAEAWIFLADDYSCLLHKRDNPAIQVNCLLQESVSALYTDAKWRRGKRLILQTIKWQLIMKVQTNSYIKKESTYQRLLYQKGIWNIYYGGAVTRPYGIARLHQDFQFQVGFTLRPLPITNKSTVL